MNIFDCLGQLLSKVWSKTKCPAFNLPQEYMIWQYCYQEHSRTFTNTFKKNLLKIYSIYKQTTRELLKIDP